MPAVDTMRMYMAIRNCLGDLRNLGFSARVGTSKFDNETIRASKEIMGDRKDFSSVDKLCAFLLKMYQQHQTKADW